MKYRLLHLLGYNTADRPMKVYPLLPHESISPGNPLAPLQRLPCRSILGPVAKPQKEMKVLQCNQHLRILMAMTKAACNAREHGFLMPGHRFGLLLANLLYSS